MSQADLNISPVYEGWLARDDGSFDLVFGYMNREWDEETTISLGPGNTMDPGGPDLGQPTHFFPRRNRFVFTVRVPKDFGTKEIVWTLTSKGRTEKAYGTLRPDYVLDDTVIMSNIGAGGALSTSPDMVGNKAPTLSVEGAKSRTAKVGEPVALAAIATDDGKPNKRNMPALLGGTYTLPQSANGLRLSFFVYRGPGKAVDLRPAADQGLGRHAGRRRLTVVGGLRRASDSRGQQVAGPRDLRRAWHLRRPGAGPRRRALHLAGHHRRSSADSSRPCPGRYSDAPHHLSLTSQGAHYDDSSFVRWNDL